MSDITLIINPPSIISLTGSIENGIFVNIEPSAGGAGNFIELSDVPQSYDGEAGNAVVVKSDESGLEFVPASGTGDMTKVVYDPTSINGSPFDTDNHTDGITNKVFTAIEKTKLSGLHQVTISVTEPLNPVTGDIWIDIS